MKRKLTVALFVVATSVLLLAGTSYAMGAFGHAQRLAGQGSGCGGSAMSEMHATMWSTLAASLDMTTEQLDEEVASGMSLTEIARERGVKPDQLVEELLAAMETALDDQVAQGSLSSSEAGEMLEAARIHMTPEHLANMGNMTGHMSGLPGAGVDMNAMHRSMHGPGSDIDMDAMHDSMGGQGEAGANHCGGNDQDEIGNPVRSMMRGMI